MGELTRNVDWSTSPLGTPDQWPQSLRTTLSLLLHSAFPTFLVWGRETMICFYNDAYRPSLGNQGVHPAIGKSYPEVWPEAWDFVGPLFRQVLNTGQAVYFENLLVPIERNGKLDDVWWTFSYSPAFDDHANINGIFVTCTETTRVVIAQKLAEEIQQQVLALFEQSPVGIAIISADNLTFRMANPFYGELTGRAPEALVGKSLLEALPELRGQGFDELLNGVIATGTPYIATEVPAHVVRHNQLETLYVNLTYQPQRDKDGRISGILVVCTDVTQQVLARKKIEESEQRYRNLSTELEQLVQQRTEELEAANEELATSNEELAAHNEEYAAINEELEEANGLLIRSNENLERFAYVASHDLQEPLRKIQQFGDLLKTRYASAEREELIYLERMQSAASRMSTLIRDLLDFSRISTRRNIAKPVSLTEVVGWALTTLELVIKETGAIVTVETLPTILGDASQLDQLFQNLLSNALKFRKANQAPVIRINSQQIAASNLPPSVKPTRSAQQYYRIDVADNGVGFDEKYLDRIFQVFQRLYGKNEFVGTGIGLAICEKVAVNHGGAITAASQPGQGATFSVYLPV